MKRLLALASAVLAIAASAAPAQAALITITFEGQANTIYGSPITRSGFDIGNVAGDEQHFHEIDSTAFPGFVPNNGTGVLYNDRDTRIFFTPNAGAGFSVFTLNSIDVATDLNGGLGGSTSLLVQGFLNNVPTGVINVPLNQGGAFTNVNGLSLGIVDRVVFNGLPTATGNGGFTLDNATLDNAPVITPVPEPATLAVFGTLAAGALGLRRRLKPATA